MCIRTISYSRRLPLRPTGSSSREMLLSVISVGSHKFGVNRDSVERPLQSLGKNRRTKREGDKLRRGQCQAKLEL